MQRQGRLVAVLDAGAAAQEARGEWRALKALERGRLLVDIGRAIRAKTQEIADLEQAETGKPSFQTPFEVEAAAQYFEFYGGLVPTVAPL